MCGIAGGNLFTEDTIQQSLDDTKHRGYDAQQVFQDDEVFLGHNRLSIQDLSSNSNQSGSMSITTLPGRRYLATYYDSANSGTTQVVILTVNANGDGWSAGSPTALKANGCYVAAIFGIHTTGGRVAFSVRGNGTSQLTNGRMALICGDAGTTGSTWTYRSFSDNIFGEPTSYCISLDYDSTNDVIGVQAGNGSLMEIVGMRIASGTGANITKGTKYTLTTSTLNDSRHICKHVSGTTWVSEWAAGTNGPIYLNTTTINSSLAASNGSQYSLSGSGNNHGVGLDVTNEGRLLSGWQHNNNVAKVKPSRETPAFAKAKIGIIPKATYGEIACSSLISIEFL